ncbi:hypothetical protein [Marinobacter salicampi]|uniref:hypothetical protein n=1 Tax=Marinobacter salicampi TaxID=435907 RepID=UPI001409C02A|nr:hypothetical protein [Marinobacter salicampi]
MHEETPEKTKSRPGRLARALKRWSDQENQYLKEHYHTTPMEELCYLLEGRSKSAIVQQAGVLGLWGAKRVEAPERWTQEEKDVLKTYYPDNGLEVCALLLLDRSFNAIALKVRRLGLKRRGGPKTNRITKSEWAYILSNVPSMGFVAVAQMHGDTPDNLRDKCSRKGVDCDAIDLAFNDGEFVVGPFTEDEVSYIEKHFWEEGGVRVAKVLRRSPKKVINFAKRRLNLTTKGPGGRLEGLAPDFSLLLPVLHTDSPYQRLYDNGLSD